MEKEKKAKIIRAFIPNDEYLEMVKLRLKALGVDFDELADRACFIDDE